jgi:hypothetical protein
MSSVNPTTPVQTPPPQPKFRSRTRSALQILPNTVSTCRRETWQLSSKPCWFFQKLCQYDPSPGQSEPLKRPDSPLRKMGGPSVVGRKDPSSETGVSDPARGTGLPAFSRFVPGAGIIRNSFTGFLKFFRRTRINRDLIFHGQIRS